MAVLIVGNKQHGENTRCSHHTGGKNNLLVDALEKRLKTDKK